MTCPDSTFDEIVAGFYRAAHDGLAWPQALAPMAMAMGAQAVRLDAFDRTRPSLVFSHVAHGTGGPAGPAAGRVDRLACYYRTHPEAARVLRLAPGHWLPCPAHFGSEAIGLPIARRGDPGELATVHDHGHAHVTRLLEEGPLAVVLGVLLPQDAPPPGNSGAAARLARHLAEAVRIQCRPGETPAAAFAAQLLRPLRAPVAIVDMHRHFVLRNPAAEKLLTRTRVLTQAQGRLGCRRHVDDMALDAQLREVAKAGSEGAAFLNARGTEGDTSCGLYLRALLAGPERDAPPGGALVMVLLHENSAGIDVDPRLLAARYGLTQAEARVGVALAGGLAPDAIAAAHGVAITTVRSQLRALLKKTGVTRQTELMGTLAGLWQSSPAPASRQSAGPRPAILHS